MKKFTKNAYINSECLKNNEIIKFESHYLRIKEDTFCNNCFFKKNKNYDCYQMIYCQRKDGSTILFEELTEIERLILLEGEKNEYEKNNRRS